MAFPDGKARGRICPDSGCPNLRHNARELHKTLSKLEPNLRSLPVSCSQSGRACSKSGFPNLRPLLAICKKAWSNLLHTLAANLRPFPVGCKIVVESAQKVCPRTFAPCSRVAKFVVKVAPKVDPRIASLYSQGPARECIQTVATSLKQRPWRGVWGEVSLSPLGNKYLGKRERGKEHLERGELDSWIVGKGEGSILKTPRPRGSAD